MNNKIQEGIISLTAIIVLLSSVLAFSIFNGNGNITGFAINQKHNSNAKSIIPELTEINDIRELTQLNEGWYRVMNGQVYYLEIFSSYIPLYIKVRDEGQQNLVIAIDGEGNMEVGRDFSDLVG